MAEKISQPSSKEFYAGITSGGGTLGTLAGYVLGYYVAGRRRK